MIVQVFRNSNDFYEISLWVKKRKRLDRFQ
jgi:hypothetical protein